MVETALTLAAAYTAERHGSNLKWYLQAVGHWYDRSLLNSQFRRFIDQKRDKLNLTHNLTIYGLRHTNAALLLYAGEDIENISAHLGHASSDITSRVYAHMYAEVKVRMAKTVSHALFKKL